MAFTVGIAGITGKFGRFLAIHLLQNPAVTIIRGYCRDPSKFPSSLSSSPKVQLFQGDAFDKEKIASFVGGCDVVACAYLGDDKLMAEGQKALIDACETAKVPRYIASDWSLDFTKLEFGEFVFKDPMKHVKAYLETKKVVAGVHILVGGFMEVIFSPIPQIFDPTTKTFRYWGEGTEPWEGTSYDNAAAFTAAVAVDPTAVGIQRFLGDRKSIKEIAGAFEKVYGIEPKLERLGSLDDLKTQMHELRAQNPDDPYKYMVKFFTYYWINGQTFVGPEVDNAKYPQVIPETWEDFFKKRSLDQLTGSYFGVASKN